MDASSTLAVAIAFAGFYAASGYFLLCTVLRLIDDILCGSSNAFRNTKECVIAVVLICAILYVAVHNPISFNYNVSAVM